ncbi:L-type lectin-domain containing receptor kinase S.6 [Striga hermonthica]|uniref:L-type lectin-domain containing receptor kinase S.6 n=1 Tax=Striga hermonthica TaxID=68872 RepID=A0A9N7MRG6_STRHE|nr:L-type lectin-domain containing receptor kinase S.6 [Striga hermonthica]
MRENFSFSAKIFIALSIIFITPSRAAPISPSNNVTLYGGAFLSAATIVLSKEKSCPPLPPPPLFPPSAAVGRAFYARPLRFLDPTAGAAASFSCIFSFSVTVPGSCPAGDGFAFMITSQDANFSGLYDGYMGLPAEGSDYLSVEFDTSFDPILGDINDNHVGVDVKSIRSVSAVDLLPRGLDLKSRKGLTAWIEYREPEKSIRVWIGPSKEKLRPPSPVLDAQIDLSKHFKEFMHVGFTASSTRGSSGYSINSWQFKTFFGPLPSALPMDGHECIFCSPTDSNFQIGPFNYQPSRKRRIWGVALVSGGLALVTITFMAAFVSSCVYCMRRRRKRLRRAHSKREMRKFQGGRMVPKMLSLTEIKSATNDFNRDKIIGEGASAVVYGGAIPSFGPVAVKRFANENLTNSSSSISKIPFNTEFATMAGCLRHKNLVQLQGWCCEKNELVLVYEYMANGSLDRILHNRTHLTRALTWESRLNIILGVASALVYLHEECESQIIHRDVKTCNILLDSEFNAKLGDFGLAEVYRHSLRTRLATVPAGTMGYLAPEYVFTGVPSVKTDAFSFGVVVLEILTGRRPVDEEGVVLGDYVWNLWEKGMISEAADGNLLGLFDRADMERALIVGLCCAHPDCVKRLTVREAVRVLKGECPLPVLPARKPTVRIQSVVGQLAALDDEIESSAGDTPWSTPRTHFSKK